MKRSWVEQVMGMPASLLLRAETLTGVEDVVAAAYAELRRADTTFSTYAEGSEISRLRSGRLARGDVSPLVHEVLDLCQQARVETDGWFDIDLPGGLDPSGLVKGWAIERAMGILRGLGDVDVCLNVGGDIAVHVRPGRPPFRVGIEDPRCRGRLVDVVALAAGGLATSGTAARGMHILDPHTGQPAAELASLSVVGPSLMWADVCATAAFARGRRGIEWVTGLSAYEAMAVHVDGTVETTSRWSPVARVR